MKKYLLIEFGNSTYTEFLMNTGNFEETSDGIYIGIFEAESEEMADKLLLKEFPERKFDNIYYYELK